MGEVFAGRYELVDPIGRGGIGAVWRAWDHRRRRYVAAKVLQQSDAHTLLRFVREQAVRIDHPHVLAPVSWAADDDKVLFTMDLVAGGSLAHLIGDYGPLPPRYVCVLLDQLLAGLAAVHAEGIVHRDIKPANLLLEATGTARPHLRVSDFGISMRKGEPRLTEADRVVGTPGYFAPEQLLGAEPDFPADLFAAGLVALYLLEGHKPDAKALVEYFAEHGTPGAPQGVPEPLWDVLAALLQPDPHARFRTATGARKALAAAVELLPAAAPEGRDGDSAAAAEPVEVFDQIGPLPAGFDADGPRGRRVAPGRASGSGQAPDPGPAAGPGSVPAPASVPRPTAGPGPVSGSDHGAGPRPAPASAFRAPADPRRPTGSPSVPAPGHGPGSATEGSARERPGAEASTPAPHAPGAPPPPAAAPAYPPAQVPPAAAPAAPDAVAPSDTGGFPLAPPRPGHRPADGGPPAPPGPPPPGDPLGADPFTPTRSAPGRAPTRAPGRVAAAAHAHAAAPRPGPTAKVAVPVLLLALVCFAVGFWALSRS